MSTSKQAAKVKKKACLYNFDLQFLQLCGFLVSFVIKKYAPDSTFQFVYVLLS